MLGRITETLKQTYNSIMGQGADATTQNKDYFLKLRAQAHADGDYVTADQHEREWALDKLKQFIDKEAERNAKGELSSNNIEFNVSRYGILSHEDERELTEYAASKGLPYYHRSESVFKNGRYQDAKTIKSHVIGAAFGKDLAVIPFNDQDKHSQTALMLLSAKAKLVGNYITADQYERQWAIQKIKDFIDTESDRNDRGQLTSARVNFEISRHGIISHEDARDLEQYAAERGIAYYHKESQKETIYGYADSRVIHSHVIGEQFGKDLG